MLKGSSFHREIVLSGIVLTLLVIAVPVSASFAFQNVAINPAATPLVPGQKIATSGQLVIIPQGGSTTFVGSNQLQLSTQLNAAQWEVQVMVNGVPAANIPGNGNVLFINGFLLSYPTSSDVMVLVNVTGLVPGPGDPVIILVQAVQLNNAGQTIPGSMVTISEPVAAPVVSAASVTPPVIQAVTVTEPVTPATRAPGLTALFVLFAMAFSALVIRKIG